MAALAAGGGTAVKAATRSVRGFSAAVSRARPLVRGGNAGRGAFLEDVFQAKKVGEGAKVFQTKVGKVAIDLGTVEQDVTFLNEVKFYKGKVPTSDVTSLGLNHAEGVTASRRLATNLGRAERGALNAVR